MESSATQAESSRRLRVESKPLPRSVEGLVSLFRRVIELPRIQRVEVTGTQFTVERLVGDGEAVVPEDHADAEVDADFVLTKLQESESLDVLVFDPMRHPHMSFLKATHMVTQRRLRASHVIAPEGEWLGAFLGLPAETVPESCFGMTVLYTKSELFENKIVVLGGPTHLLVDVSYGVVIDMGD